MHPFLLKLATGISVVCSQKPCWAQQGRKQRNERKPGRQWKPAGRSSAVPTRARSGLLDPVLCAQWGHTGSSTELGLSCWLDMGWNLNLTAQSLDLLGQFLIFWAWFTHLQNGNSAICLIGLWREKKLGNMCKQPDTVPSDQQVFQK